MDFFGTDGIRDIAGTGRLAPEIVVRAGRALGLFAAKGAAGRPRVCIGCDPRPSGPDLTARLASALAAEGADVVDFAVLPSPAVAWAVARDGFDLGVAVSASHNPPEYNGIKPFARGGGKLSVEAEQEIEALMRVVSDEAPPAGSAKRVQGATDYVEATSAWLEEGGAIPDLHYVVDLSAGAASVTAPDALARLGMDATFLHEAGTRDINDGCGSEHPRAWLDALVARGAAVGIAFDGDADRVLLADAEGALLDGHDALAILAHDWKKRGRLPGDVVVSTVMANLGLEERLASFGVRLERTAVGDRNVAHRMRETGASLGGEPSGHIVMERDGALIGDALIAAVRVLQAAGRAGSSLAALRRLTPRYPQILRNVHVRRRRPISEWPELETAIRDTEAGFEGRGRVVVRYSGTEPLLRIMAEGKDDGEVRDAVARIESVAEVLRAPA